MKGWCTSSFFCLLKHWIWYNSAFTGATDWETQSAWKPSRPSVIGVTALSGFPFFVFHFLRFSLLFFPRSRDQSYRSKPFETAVSHAHLHRCGSVMVFLWKTALFFQKPSAEGNVTPEWRWGHQRTSTHSTGLVTATHLYKLLYG